MNAPHPWVEASVKIVRSAERIGIPEIRERKSCQSGRMAKTRGSERHSEKKTGLSDLINEDDIEEASGINDPEDPIS